MTMDQVSGAEVPQVEVCFFPSDFTTSGVVADFYFSSEAKAFACDIANRKLKKILAEARTVYGCVPPGETGFYWFERRTSKDTHSAKLICIRELPKEKPQCDHDGNPMLGPDCKRVWICVKCGTKLRATFTEEGE